MARYRSLPVLALRRMLGSWRLLTSVALGTLIAAAILSATAIFADAIRDLGLSFALEQPAATKLDLSVTRSNLRVRASGYDAARGRLDGAVGGAIRPASGEVVRQGTSDTFFPSPPGRAPDLANEGRPRANLRFRSDLAKHVEVVEGTLAAPVGAAIGGPLPVALGAETARRNGFKVGDRIDLHAWWDPAVPSLAVQIVGLVRPRSGDERYWGRAGPAIDASTASWETYVLLVPEATFFGALAERAVSLNADYIDVYQLDLGALHSRNAGGVADRVDGLIAQLRATEDARVETDLPGVLRGYDEKLFFVRIPLFVLMLQIGGIVAYYLLMVSTMLVEREAAEIATLRSRGATTGQLLAQYVIEGLILAALAVIAGPPLAAAVISALGPTPAFSALSGGDPLEVHISRLSYLLAAGGALLALGAFLLPAWHATRTTIVEFKRGAARPRRTPLLLRYYLDVALVIALGLVFWRLRQQEDLFTRTLFGERQADPLLLATPAVLMVTVGVVFLRLFPPVLRFVSWLVDRTRSAAVIVGMRALSRSPTHYARLILMLMLATGVGMFGATFSATLDRSYDDRARYAVGADVRATDVRAFFGYGDGAFLQAVAQVPSERSSSAIRLSASVISGDRPGQITLLGVDPQSFGDVAFFRDDFADQPLDELLSVLASNRLEATASAILPEGARQVGVWVKASDIRGPVTLSLTLSDSMRQTITAPLGNIAPTDAAARDWRFFAVDVSSLRGIPSAPATALVPPIALQSVLIGTQSGIAAQRGVVLLGPVLASSAPPLGREPAAQAPVDARLVHDPSGPGFEVIQGYRSEPVSDQVRPEADAPRGARASARYEWFEGRRPPAVRGVRRAGDGAPLELFLSSRSAETLGLRKGGEAQLFVGGRYLRMRLAGTFELFPTFDARNAREGFGIVEASRLLGEVNSAPASQPLRLNEAWFTSDDAGATRAALARFNAQQLRDLPTELRLQQEDPLIAAGWQGILTISFATVLLLSAVGFLVYSYLTAQQRGLEFAILRTLGFSRVQVVLVVLVEYVFIIAAGTGLGTAVGLQVGRRMMELLATDERGDEVLPPFLLAVSWPEVFVVWAILGSAFALTIGAVVLLYVRLAVYRALRVGDA